MMKQITPEIKAKIFALYLGAELCIPNKPKETWWPFDQNEGGLRLEGVINTRVVVFRIAEQKYDTFNQTALHLRGLSSITDKDLIKCYHISCALIGYDYTMDFKDTLYSAKHCLKSEGKKFLYKYTECSDYLRSKGYALPAFGYSVDELVESGVFKLKEVNNE